MTKKKEIKTRWYYDACALDEKIYADILREVTNRGNPKLAVLSHLALGEVYGNLFVKKGKEQMDAFTGFLDLLNEKGHIKIIGNDEAIDILDRINGILPDLSLTDLIHIATAIKNGCSNILSDDRDLTGIEKVKMNRIKKVAISCGVNDFCITWIKRK